MWLYLFLIPADHVQELLYLVFSFLVKDKDYPSETLQCWEEHCCRFAYIFEDGKDRAKI